MLHCPDCKFTDISHSKQRQGFWPRWVQRPRAPVQPLLPHVAGHTTVAVRASQGGHTACHLDTPLVEPWHAPETLAHPVYTFWLWLQVSTLPLSSRKYRCFSHFQTFWQHYIIFVTFKNKQKFIANLFVCCTIQVYIISFISSDFTFSRACKNGNP